MIKKQKQVKLSGKTDTFGEKAFAYLQFYLFNLFVLVAPKCHKSTNTFKHK